MAAVLTLLIGCSHPSEPQAEGTRILLRGGGAEPDSLDPQRARAVESQTILRDLCEGLTTLDREARPAPGVASTWHADPSGRTWTFQLRSDARWSNGDAVRAEDFVASLRRLVDPQTGSQYAQVVDVIAGAREIIAGRAAPSSLGVEAPDPGTLVIRLAASAPYLPGLLAHPSTCPVHRSSRAAGSGAFRAGTLVSNGAFRLARWVQGSQILLLRNRHYWNDRATRLEGVKYLLLPDEDAELTRYRAGALDVTNVVPRGQYDWIRSHLGGQLHVSPQLNTYYYGFNLQRPPFRDAPGLRRALSLVIDRETLVARVLRVGELAAWSWVPPGVNGYGNQPFDYAQRSLSERIAEARRLYAQAGYSSEHPLRFELRYNAGEVHTRLALAIASMWKQALGVDVRLTSEEFKSLLQDIDRGEVQMFRSSWSGDYNDAYTFAQYLRSDFGINLPHYRNPRYDALLDAAAAQGDPQRRRAQLEEAERMMLADHPLIPIYFYVNKHLVAPRVRGWYDNVMNVTYSRDLALAGP